MTGNMQNMHINCFFGSCEEYLLRSSLCILCYSAGPKYGVILHTLKNHPDTTMKPHLSIK